VLLEQLVHLFPLDGNEAGLTAAGEIADGLIGVTGDHEGGIQGAVTEPLQPVARGDHRRAAEVGDPPPHGIEQGPAGDPVPGVGGADIDPLALDVGQGGDVADLGYETYQKILAEAVKELKEDEFADLYAEELQAAGEEKISGENFVDECQVESDLELLFPNEYIPSSSERMLLYRELDGLELDKDLLAFKARLEDRFGKVPPEGLELLRIVPLRRLAKRLGVEKVFLKAGRMTLFFISNQESPYYQSAAFGKVIDYMSKNPRYCNLREQNGKRSMVVKNVETVETAVGILQEMVSL
jgi:hypothetical protein